MLRFRNAWILLAFLVARFMSVLNYIFGVKVSSRYLDVVDVSSG